MTARRSMSDTPPGEKVDGTQAASSGKSGCVPGMILASASRTDSEESRLFLLISRSDVCFLIHGASVCMWIDRGGVVSNIREDKRATLA